MARIAPLALALVCISGVAAADVPLVGAWFGPRIFANNSTLGYINDAPDHPMLETSIELGVRISHDFIVPWLYPEFELGFSPTHTTPTGAPSVSVAWLDPRFNLRFEVLRHGKLHPFVLVGGGSPIALSSARMTYNSGIVGDGYGGVGVRYDTGRGFLLRFDARLAVGPGVDLATGDNRAAFEGEFGFGVEIDFNHKGSTGSNQHRPMTDTTDSDGDGIPDAVDKCPDRPEDFDGFEDQDGCPDIDNDGDHVLDIADKCPNVPETYNGYEDEDGCPDTIPADVAGIVGTVEGLIYAEAETGVHDSALPAIAKIATVLKAHPGVRIVLVGHTDDRESKVFATKPAEGEPEPDLAAIAADLSHGRAEAVKQVLVKDGIPEGRIVVDGEGAEDPVMDNATPKGRLANRRVSVKLFIPAH